MSLPPPPVRPDPNHTPTEREVREDLAADRREQRGRGEVAERARVLRVEHVGRDALADLAQKSIDVQYYIWEADATGRILAERLTRAAERGVRVRFLIDDLNVKTPDGAMAAIAAHPNIEVRLFNPFGTHRRTFLPRVLRMAFGPDRLRGRLHNKAFIADNSVAIVGGRNVGAEYFGVDIDPKSNPDVLGDSAAPSTIAKLQRALGGRMIDLLFIDGNHSYEGAKRDYEAYYPLTRHLVALHDLLCETHADVKVGELWRELKRKAKDHTFVLFHRPRGHIESAVWGGQEMGIGVLVKDVDAGVGAK
jgi:hypothetical protein